MDRDGGDAGADVGAAPKPRYKTVAELEMELLLGTGDAKGKGETRAREPAPISDSDSDEIAVIGKRGKRITPCLCCSDSGRSGARARWYCSR